MGWLKVDDKLPRNPKVLAGDIETAWYYLCALTHCAEQMTDGYIADSVVPLVAPHITDPRSVAERCADLDMFRRVEGGYEVPDYLDFNPSRASVLEKREKDKSRQQSHRESRRDTESTSGVTPGVPSRPVPSDEISHHPPTATTDADLDLIDEVAAQVVKARLARQTGISHPDRWTRKTLANLRSEPVWAEIPRVCAKWPGAPVDMLAEAAEGRPSPNLNHHKQREAS